MPKTKKSQDLEAKVFEAALQLAAQRDWHDISLREIADQAGCDLGDLYGVTGKAKLVSALESWADQAMSAEPADPTETDRERLFDAIMRRFEHMEANRAGVLSMMRARPRSPRGFAKLLRARRTSADWALSAAGLDTGDTLALGAKRLGLVQVIARTERAWRDDTSGDFARTMATLDGELIALEERLGFLARFRPSQRSSGATSSRPEAPQAETGEA